MYIAIDVGGTNIRIAGSKSLEKIKFEKIVKFKTLNKYDKDLENIKNAVDEVSTGKIKAIALGLPNPLDKTKSFMVRGGNIRGWKSKNFRKDFEKEFGCKILVENDTALAAIGEATHGAGKNKDFIFIIWGTGIGGTEIKHSNGIISYFPFEPAYQYTSRATIRNFGDKTGGSGIKNPYKLNLMTWRRIVNEMALGVNNILVIRPADLVIFGGGVAINNPDKVAEIHAKLKKILKPYPVPEFKISKLGDDAGLYGALALIKMKRNNP